jgi:dihydrodipicolinate synthase/N-acetylneuraminate lyase
MFGQDMIHSVIPIPPAYDQYEELKISSVLKYVDYLNDNGAQVAMTTAGTSQFNLLTSADIHDLNVEVAHQFAGKKILGIPSLSLKETLEFVDHAHYNKIDNAFLMALYPDRFYNYDTIYTYLSKIRERVDKPLYLHAMFMRGGRGGQWNYDSELVFQLFEKQIIRGIKEEHSNLQQSYDFIRNLPKELDVIVAGGSMRRHQFLRSAGANAFLAGVGNFFPQIETQYCKGKDIDKQIKLESKLFDVFNMYGWHQCLRIGLSCLGLYPAYDRMPWPERKQHVIDDVSKVLLEIQNEK